MLVIPGKRRIEIVAIRTEPSIARSPQLGSVWSCKVLRIVTELICSVIRHTWLISGTKIDSIKCLGRALWSGSHFFEVGY